MIAAGTYSPEKMKYTNGLGNSHAYGLLGAFELSNGIWLVKMVNPWGFDGYIGDWSDKSSLWTDALRNEVGSIDDKQDGIFFQTIEQLLSDWHGI